MPFVLARAQESGPAAPASVDAPSPSPAGISNRRMLQAAQAVQREPDPEPSPTAQDGSITGGLFSENLITDLAKASAGQVATPVVQAATQWAVDFLTPYLVDGLITLGKRTLDTSGLLQAAGQMLLAYKDPIDALANWVSDFAIGAVSGLRMGVRLLTGAMHAWNSLPQAVRAPLLYLVGRGLYAMNDAFGGWIRPFPPERVNRLLVDTSAKDLTGIIDWLDWLATKLDSLTAVVGQYRSASGKDDNAMQAALLQLVADLFKWGTGYDLPGLRNSAVAWATGKLMGWLMPSAAPKQVEDTSPKQELAPSPDETPANNPLVQKDWRFVSLKVETPRLDRFDDTAGLVLDAGVVFHLFGADLAASNDLQLPFGGGFRSIAVLNLRKPSGIGFTPAFLVQQIGGKIVLTDKGLQRVAVWMTGVSIAGDLITAGHVNVHWSKQEDKLAASLGATLAVGDGIKLRGALQLSSAGAFEAGALSVESLASVPLIPGWLTLDKPGFEGAFTKDGELRLAFFASSVTSDALGLTLDDPRLQYSGDQGLVASARQLRLELGNLTITADGLKIDRDGLTLQAAHFLYNYDRTKKNTAETQAAQGIGIDSRILDQTFLDNIVVAGRITGVRINRSGIVATGIKASAAREDEPDLVSGGLQTPVDREETPTLDEPGTSDSQPAQTPRRVAIDRLGIGAFGLRGEVDFANRRVGLGGTLTVSPDIPGLSLKLPVTPGVHINAEITPVVELQAALEASGGLKDKSERVVELDPTQTAQLAGRFGVEARLGVGVGIPYVLAVEGNLTAGVIVKPQGDFTLLLVLDYDRDTGRLDPQSAKGTWKAKAALVLEVGADLTVQALFIFKKRLLSGKLKSWTLGEVAASGGFEKTSDRIGGTGKMPIQDPTGPPNMVEDTAPKWNALKPKDRRMVIDQVRKGEIETMPAAFAHAIRTQYLPVILHEYRDRPEALHKEIRLWSLVLANSGVAGVHIDRRGNIDTEAAADAIREAAGP